MRREPTRSPVDYRGLLRALAPFRDVHTLRSWASAVGTFLAFFGFWGATLVLVPRSIPLALLTALAGSLTLSRIFVLFHDCVHYALFKSVRANRFWGTVFGLMVYTPYEPWRKSHLAHHRSVGNIERSDEGYLRLHTVAEYESWSRLRRAAYRFFRWPPVLIGLVPILHFGLGHRFPAAWSNVEVRRAWISVHLTTLVLVVIHALAALQWGVGRVALVQAPIAVGGAAVAGWFFFVQHHFEGATWRSRDDGWVYHEGAVHGSGYLRLGAVLDWVWLGIGYHHVHHLDARVPCYRLRSATHAIDDHIDVRGYTLWESLPYARLALWDEAQGRLVPFPR